MILAGLKYHSAKNRIRRFALLALCTIISINPLMLSCARLNLAKRMEIANQIVKGNYDIAIWKGKITLYKNGKKLLADDLGKSMEDMVAKGKLKASTLIFYKQATNKDIKFKSVVEHDGQVLGFFVFNNRLMMARYVFEKGKIHMKIDDAFAGEKFNIMLGSQANVEEKGVFMALAAPNILFFGCHFGAVFFRLKKISGQIGKDAKIMTDGDKFWVEQGGRTIWGPDSIESCKKDVEASFFFRNMPF